MTPRTDINSYLIERFLKDKSQQKNLRKYLNELPKKVLVELLISRLQEDEVMIPLSIFSVKKLSSLELVIKFLKENLGMKNNEIASALSRSQQVVWTTYSNSKRKFSKPLPVSKSKYDIPLKSLLPKLSILESISVYLRDQGLRYSQIAKLLHRNERTVWTTYKRAMKKNEK